MLYWDQRKLLKAPDWWADKCSIGSWVWVHFFCSLTLNLKGYLSPGFKLISFCIWSSPGFIQDGFIYVFQDVFICFLLAMLGLCCCTWAFSSCGKWGSFSSGSASFSLWWLLLLQSTGFRHVDFDSCDTWASLLRDRWGLPDPGVNLHPLHWQVDS